MLNVLGKHFAGRSQGRNIKRRLLHLEVIYILPDMQTILRDMTWRIEEFYHSALLCKAKRRQIISASTERIQFSLKIIRSHFHIIYSTLKISRTSLACYDQYVVVINPRFSRFSLK